MLTLSAIVLCLASSGTMAQEVSKGSPPPTSPAPASTELSLPQLRVSGQIYVGELAPDFALSSSRDREVSLSRFRGDWVLLHFVPDRRDFAALGEVQSELSRIGVTMLGVCKDNPQSLRSYAQKENVSYELLADATGEISAIYGLYDVAAGSSRSGFVIVDRSGKVRLALMGSVPPRQLAELARYTMTGF
jgi:peroxiredoxin Q/BCP